MSRPELTGHASLFYNEKEARKYHSSSRMINVQREITLRSIELLLLPPDQTSFVLDVGCGSGLSGQVLEEHGHVWVGCDVSRDMLQVAHERMEDSFLKNDDKDEGMDDDSDEEDDTKPSTGDLLHHVSDNRILSTGDDQGRTCYSYLLSRPLLFVVVVGHGNWVALSSSYL
jgi:2-polyprenyl-3-methyl-5-hydroxy-6-metoxy-1,4-benzoquinol methylase